MNPFLLVFLLSVFIWTASTCAALDAAGHVTSYFPVLPLNAPEATEPQLIPVASNHPLDGDHKGIRNAVIVIHDQSRDANAVLSVMTSLAGGSNENTLILAPQFLADADIARFASQLPEQGKMFTRWPLDGWQFGGDSIAAPPQHGVSSFTALDLFLLYLGDTKNFPDLQQVVIAGHGMGGDFTQRYAAVGQAPDILAKQNVQVRFVVANPSSYIYFTAIRPKKDRQGFDPPDVAQCPSYNAYPYGLDQLNAYARHTGANAVKLRYASRSIFYLMGEKVVASDPSPDTGCAAMLEGTDRTTRAANYSLYLNLVFGDMVGKNQGFFTIPKAAYDAEALFGSRCGMAGLFGDGNC